jgi:hypothetical protein
MFNSDDPMNFNSELIEKAKIFDMVVTSCEANLHKYKIMAGVKKVLFLPHSFDPMYFHPLTEEEKDDEDLLDFDCDVSMILYTLYDDPFFKNQYVKRKQLLDDLIQNTDLKIKLYGPSFLKEVYPDNYVDEAWYLEQNKLFNMSKLNLVTRPTNLKKNFITDTDLKIMGSGGLLLIDNFKGMSTIFKKDENCIVINKENYIDQIKDIVKNYKDYQNIRSAAAKDSLQYTWNNWVKNIHIGYVQSKFNPRIYKQLYDLEIDDDKLWDYWLDEGMQKNHIPYNFKIPNNFNHDDYAELNVPEEKNIKKLYLHWYEHSKDISYFKKTKGKGASGDITDTEKTNTCSEEVFRCFDILSKIRNPTYDKNIMVDELGIFCENNPRVNINCILDTFFNLVD